MPGWYGRCPGGAGSACAGSPTSRTRRCRATVAHGLKRARLWERREGRKAAAARELAHFTVHLLSQAHAIVIRFGTSGTFCSGRRSWPLYLSSTASSDGPIILPERAQAWERFQLQRPPLSAAASHRQRGEVASSALEDAGRFSLGRCRWVVRPAGQRVSASWGRGNAAPPLSSAPRLPSSATSIRGCTRRE